MSNGDQLGQGSTSPSFETSGSFPESSYANPSATTGTSGTISDPSTSSRQGNPEPTDSSSEDQRIATLGELENAIESFRGRRISKTETISTILRILGDASNVSLTQVQKDSTFDSYLAEIQSIDSSFSESRIPDGEQLHNESTPQQEGVLSHGSRKHPETSDSDNESEDGSSSKRQKLSESDMPWYEEPSDTLTKLCDPSCEETRRLLRAYNRDIAKAKFFVKIARNAPAGIPSSQWERILKGDAVDLNQIFASLHHVVPDEERTGRLGDAEISFGVAEPKKRVSTAAEWSAAWRKASKAVSFAFPHRRDELVDYGEYIESEFAAKFASSHHKILLYDIALRNEVAGGQSIVLTDHHRFSRLYSAIVMPDGVESSQEPSTNKKSSSYQHSGNKPEICNKFNIGKCKSSDADCKYRHLCKKCKKPGHCKKDCPDSGGK